jgi:hypothetical protein
MHHQARRSAAQVAPWLQYSRAETVDACLKQPAQAVAEQRGRDVQSEEAHTLTLWRYPSLAFADFDGITIGGTPLVSYDSA